jgi:hypothetical protein
MTEGGRRLSLTKSDLATPAGRELLELLTSLSADGSITREELERLRAWLEANREAPIRPREFLTSIVIPFRKAERSPRRSRQACEQLDIGDAVRLDREPGNVENDNAILVLSEDGEELGYVPREDARRMAPLFDAGARPQRVIWTGRSQFWLTIPSWRLPFSEAPSAHRP